MKPMMTIQRNTICKMTAGGFADECLLSRPSGTLSSIQNGGEGWGEEVPPNRSLNPNHHP